MSRCVLSRFVDSLLRRVVPSPSGRNLFVGRRFLAGMKFLRCMVASGLLFAVLLIAACETDLPKKTAAKLPSQATAPTVAPSNPNSGAAQPSAAPAAAPDPQSAATDALIAQAEKLYSAGQTDYQAGRSEE